MSDTSQLKSIVITATTTALTVGADCLARSCRRQNEGAGYGLARRCWVGRPREHNWSKTRNNRFPMVQVD